jgi:hypothetical protein
MTLKYDKIDHIVEIFDADEIDWSETWHYEASLNNMMRETHTRMNMGHMVGNWQIKYSKGKSKNILKWRLDKTYRAYQTLYMEKTYVMDKINSILWPNNWHWIHQMKFLTQINWLHVLDRLF